MVEILAGRKIHFKSNKIFYFRLKGTDLGALNIQIRDEEAFYLIWRVEFREIVDDTSREDLGILFNCELENEWDAWVAW